MSNIPRISANQSSPQQLPSPQPHPFQSQQHYPGSFIPHPPHPTLAQHSMLAQNASPSLQQQSFHNQHQVSEYSPQPQQNLNFSHAPKTTPNLSFQPGILRKSNDAIFNVPRFNNVSRTSHTNFPLEVTPQVSRGEGFNIQPVPDEFPSKGPMSFDGQLPYSSKRNKFGSMSLDDDTAMPWRQIDLKQIIMHQTQGPQNVMTEPSLKMVPPSYTRALSKGRDFDVPTPNLQPLSFPSNNNNSATNLTQNIYTNEPQRDLNQTGTHIYQNSPSYSQRVNNSYSNDNPKLSTQPLTTESSQISLSSLYMNESSPPTANYFDHPELSLAKTHGGLNTPSQKISILDTLANQNTYQSPSNQKMPNHIQSSYPAYLPTQDSKMHSGYQPYQNHQQQQQSQAPSTSYPPYNHSQPIYGQHTSLQPQHHQSQLPPYQQSQPQISQPPQQPHRPLHALGPTYSSRPQQYHSQILPQLPFPPYRPSSPNNAATNGGFNKNLNFDKSKGSGFSPLLGKLALQGKVDRKESLERK